jgi:hypothetical protein
MAIHEYNSQEELDVEFERIMDLQQRYERLKEEISNKEAQLDWAEEELEYARRELEMFEQAYHEELFR